MKKKVVVALSLCGLVLSQPASGMHWPMVPATRPEILRRPHPYYPDYIYIHVDYTAENRRRVEKAIARLIPGLPYLKAFLGGDRYSLNPEYAATPIPEGHTDFRVQNGLCGLGRNVILRLQSLMRYCTANIKQLMGVTADFLLYRTNSYFVKVRYASREGPVLSDLIDAAASLEYKSSVLYYDKSSLEAYAIETSLPFYNTPRLWQLLRETDRGTDPIRYAAITYTCLYGDGRWDYTDPEFGAWAIPLDHVNPWLPILVKTHRLGDLSLEQSHYISARGAFAAGCDDIFKDLRFLAWIKKMDYPRDWEDAENIFLKNGGKKS